VISKTISNPKPLLLNTLMKTIASSILVTMKTFSMKHSKGLLGRYYLNSIVELKKLKSYLKDLQRSKSLRKTNKFNLIQFLVRANHQLIIIREKMSSLVSTL